MEDIKNIKKECSYEEEKGRKIGFKENRKKRKKRKQRG